MRESLEKKYDLGNAKEDEIKKYKLITLIKSSVLVFIYLLMIVYSLIRIKRCAVFFSILSEGKIISIYTIALVLFYISLYIVFIYYLCVVGYIVYMYIKKDDWLPLVHKYSIKLDLATFVFKCLSILLFIMIYITTPCTVKGRSMYPTFNENDRIMCRGLFYNPKRDDIVVFDAINYTKDSSFYIKRVTAIAGDTISYNESTNLTSINGEVVIDITYYNYNTMRDSVGQTGNSFVVPKGYVMVLGDNRDASYDSRKFGLIKKEDIFGKVYIRVLPLNAIDFY